MSCREMPLGVLRQLNFVARKAIRQAAAQRVVAQQAPRATASQALHADLCQNLRSRAASADYSLASATRPRFLRNSRTIRGNASSLEVFEWPGWWYLNSPVLDAL